MTVFAVVGAYSINQSLFDVVCLICFGVLGYGMRRFGYSAGAMIIGFILGPLLERAFDQSMTISDGSFLIFVERPIALGLLILTGAVRGQRDPCAAAQRQVRENGPELKAASAPPGPACFDPGVD